MHSSIGRIYPIRYPRRSLPQRFRLWCVMPSAGCFCCHVWGSCFLACRKRYGIIVVRSPVCAGRAVSFHLSSEPAEALQWNIPPTGCLTAFFTPRISPPRCFVPCIRMKRMPLFFAAFCALRQPVQATGCRRAFLFLWKGVREYESELHLPPLRDPLGL